VKGQGKNHKSRTEPYSMVLWCTDLMQDRAAFVHMPTARSPNSFSSILVPSNKPVQMTVSS
jgi:hypothetical protein